MTLGRTAAAEAIGTALLLAIVANGSRRGTQLSPCSRMRLPPELDSTP